MKKNNNGGGANNNKNHEGKSGLVRTVVFKIGVQCDRCFRESLKAVCEEYGVESVKVDTKKSLVTVCGDIDPLSVVRILRKKSGFPEIVSVGPMKKLDAEEAKNGSGGGGGGDEDGNGGGGDDNGSGGGDNMKNDRGGCGDSDGNDRDKAEEGGGGGGGNSKGSKMDFMGEAGFDYRYGYHGGSENGCPTGQLHCPGRFITTQVPVN